MDAKYNYIIDSMKWRIGLNLAGFILWLATTVALLRLTSRKDHLALLRAGVVQWQVLHQYLVNECQRD